MAEIKRRHLSTKFYILFASYELRSSEFAATDNVVLNVNKSQCLIVASKNNAITRPNCQLCGAGLPYADSYTYLGHIISSDLMLIL